MYTIVRRPVRPKGRPEAPFEVTKVINPLTYKRRGQAEIMANELNRVFRGTVQHKVIVLPRPAQIPATP